MIPETRVKRPATMTTNVSGRKRSCSMTQAIAHIWQTVATFPVQLGFTFILLPLDAFAIINRHRYERRDHQDPHNGDLVRSSHGPLIVAALSQRRQFFSVRSIDGQRPPLQTDHYVSSVAVAICFVGACFPSQ